jgi:hypothetical protein
MKASKGDEIPETLSAPSRGMESGTIGDDDFKGADGSAIEHPDELVSAETGFDVGRLQPRRHASVGAIRRNCKIDLIREPFLMFTKV